jgi:hypothetical protein
VTKRQQKQLLSQAIGAAFAFRSTSGVSSSASASQDRSNPELSGDAIVFPEGSLGDLSGAVESNTSTGFYFPDGNGFAIVIDGEEVATFTSDGLTLKGSVLAGDEGTEDTPSSTLSNVIGVTADAGGNWANLSAVEFATFPLVTTNPTGFYVFLSEDNGAISKSEKIYFFSLLGKTSGIDTFRCVPSLVGEAGPTYWDIIARVNRTVATLFVRRFNGATTTNTSNCKVNVAVVSEAIGAVQVRPPIALAGDFPTKGLEGGQVAKKILIVDPTSTGHTAFSTKQNGRTATGGTGGVSTAQDKTLFSFPSSSPARINGVTTENTTDVYVPRVKWVSTSADSEKVYDWDWADARYVPNYVPNDPGTGVTRAAHQHKMGAGATPVAQTFVWPPAAPTTGTYLLQTAFNSVGNTHTLGYTNASSLTNAVQNGDAPNGIKTVRQVSQSTYNNLSKDANTLYIIV